MANLEKQKKGGCPYGSHRSLEPRGVLPQGAYRLDTALPIYDNEILVELGCLNLDSASFRQIDSICKGRENKIAKVIKKRVNKNGKLQNPITGSGGMFAGKVKEVGESLKQRGVFIEGQNIASLVSLTLTPLIIEKVLNVKRQNCQIDINGYAILFESGKYFKLPEDMPDKLVLSALDVCGGPAHISRLLDSKKNIKKIVVIGAAGHAGSLICAVAKEKTREGGMVIAIEKDRSKLAKLREAGLADIYLELDCLEPIKIAREVGRVTDGGMADLSVDVGNVPGLEAASILSLRDGGTALFFNMATSFSKATLIAEGFGKDVNLIMGNGYVPNHAELAVETLRKNKAIWDLLI